MIKIAESFTISLKKYIKTTCKYTYLLNYSKLKMSEVSILSIYIFIIVHKSKFYLLKHN